MDSTYDVYYLNFHAPLHLGNHKPESYESSESFLRSDTLMAAIYATWAKLGHSDWIPEGEDLPFVVSSAFPFWISDQGQKVHFFPKPNLSYTLPGIDSSVSIKAFKKVTWVEQSFLEQILAQQHFVPEAGHIQGNFLSTCRLPKSGILIREASHRVSIPRDRGDGSDPSPFVMERLRFVNSGLFLLAKGADTHRLKTALEFLQYEGFGTDRSTGNGFFQLESAQITLSVPDQASHAINLGLFCPEDRDQLQDMTDEHSQYELIKRGGWITSAGYQTLEKNSIYMFAEGGIWKTRAREAGRARIDLSPDYPLDHPVLRCGKTLFLPMALQ
jgi:CRISPR type III-A-associated RAMP protein Csm4